MRVQGRRTLAVAAISGALLLTGGIGGFAPAQVSGPTATAAKKRCGKKCRKRRARQYVGGNSFTRALINSVTGASSSETYNFCRNGTFTFRGDHSGLPRSWSDTYNGTWTVKSAGTSSARVAYTTSNFKSVYSDGSPGPGTPPPASGVMVIGAESDKVAFIGGTEFSRSDGGC